MEDEPACARSKGVIMATHQQKQELAEGGEDECVIERFTNEGEGWLGMLGRDGVLSYQGGILAGKAEGRGTVRCKGGAGRYLPFTILHAEFSCGRMLPCRAVRVRDDTGDAYAGPLAAGGRPAAGARGAYLRGADGGRFQGEWPDGADSSWDRPRRGAAWVAASGCLYAVALDAVDGVGDILSDDGRTARPGCSPTGGGSRAACAACARSAAP